MTSFATFYDALAVADGQRNLLIGNGLSIAFDQKFGYAHLFDAADFAVKDPEIASIFRHLDTKDFETVAAALNTAINVASSCGEHALSNRLQQKVDNLKTALIDAVNATHPHDRNCLTIQQCRNLRDFLCPFLEAEGCVFSLNYDALLYWSLLREKETRFSFADGFSAKGSTFLKFEGDRCPRPVNVLFPHGALFIFDQGGDAFKPRANSDPTEKPLLDIIRENLSQGKFPIFVSEGSDRQKLGAIRKSFYLNYAFEMIERQKDNFFIFGHSLDYHSDGHILTKIAANKEVKRIFASYYGNEDPITGNLHHIRQLANRSEKDLEIHTFPAESVTCW